MVISIGWVLLKGDISIGKIFNPAKFTTEEHQNTEEIEEWESKFDRSIEDAEKVEQFLLERLLDPDGLLHFHLDNEEPVETTTEELKKDILHMFFNSIKNQDTFLLSSVLTPAAVQSIWKNETDPDKRIQSVEKALSNLSRNKTIKSFSYRYNVDEYNRVQDEGIMKLEYSDGIKVDIPIEFIVTDGSEHEDESATLYYLNTSLEEMNRIVLEAK